MLVADFGFATVEPAYPTLVGGFPGFGAYTEGVCAEGKDYVCNVKDGLFTCRPCNFPQLAVFKQLQHLANRLAVAFEIGSQHLAETDARLGRITATLVGKVSGPLAAKLAAPAVLASAITAARDEPTSHDTFRKIAAVVPEFVDWFSAGVGLIGAPATYPTPPPQPRAAPSGDGPIKLPSPELPAVPPIRSKLRGAGLAVGVLGVITAIGLVAAAHFSKKGRRLR
jgi:hypothetical protein